LTAIFKYKKNVQRM